MRYFTDVLKRVINMNHHLSAEKFSTVIFLLPMNPDHNLKNRLRVFLYRLETWDFTQQQKLKQTKRSLGTNLAQNAVVRMSIGHIKTGVIYYHKL